MLPPQVISGSSQMQAIAIGRNPWTCRCRFMQEMTQFVVDNAMIIQDAQDIYCIEEGHRREIDFNATMCNDYYADGASGIPNLILQNGYIQLMIIGLATICLLVMFAILYLFREPLRLWLFAHYGLRVFGAPCEDSNKRYDAFFLHSAKDAEYIIKYIASDLENGHDRTSQYRLCLQHRDLAEDATYVHLLEMIRASRKIVILLSRNFLQTEWSRCDVKRAIHESVHDRPEKLVIIEDPDVLLDAENDIELLPYMKTSAIKRIRRGDRKFWDKLRYALPIEPLYRGNNYTIDHQRALPHYHSHTMPQHHITTMMNHERYDKYHNSNATLNGSYYRQAPPPAYNPEIDETNYSSATTATPSPRPSRHGIITVNTGDFRNQTMHLTPNPISLLPMHQNIHRAPSEHIYSSIDSDYGGYDPQHQLLPHPMHQHQSSIGSNASVHRPIPAWRNNNIIVDNNTINANPQGSRLV